MTRVDVITQKTPLGAVSQIRVEKIKKKKVRKYCIVISKRIHILRTLFLARKKNLSYKIFRINIDIICYNIHE